MCSAFIYHKYNIYKLNHDTRSKSVPLIESLARPITRPFQINLSNRQYILNANHHAYKKKEKDHDPFNAKLNRFFRRF